MYRNLISVVFIAGCTAQPQSTENVDLKPTASRTTEAKPDQDYTKRLRYIAFVPGTCTDLKVERVDKTSSCKEVMINSSFTNGRATISFTYDGHLLTFSSGKDFQPSYSFYEMEVDHVRLDDDSDVIPVKGVCHITGDILKKSSVGCVAYRDNAAEPTYQVSFESLGEPKIIKK